MVTHFDMDLNPTVAIKDLKEELVAQVNGRKRKKETPTTMQEQI